MTDDPAADASAVPDTVMVATVGVPDVQMFIRETSREPVEQVAVAV